MALRLLPNLTVPLLASHLALSCLAPTPQLRLLMFPACRLYLPLCSAQEDLKWKAKREALEAEEETTKESV